MDSQAIVNTMEVLETKPLNELVTEAVIKVCYVSDMPNQNGTVITKEVGKEIASTLPGAPVAGFFNKETGSFEEHNRVVKFSNGELEFEDVTKAYGFVSPNDKPWYQDFVEDGKVRTYIMCKAYLWTRQYEEASLALDKGQSMELDEKTMSGYYQGDVFIFTSVTLDKLCILGDNFAPCFEGAKIIKTYCKQFDGLAEQLEKTIGRRYYVMDNQLVTKPDKVTLDYALELGWNLTDAIYVQLANRGSQNKYDVEGVYSENGEIFAILQDRESLEYVRCVILISSQDTVELAAEMIAVKQSWTPKAPPAPAPVQPLNDAATSTDPVPQAAPLYTTTTDGGAAEPAGEPAAEPVTEPVVEPAILTEPAVEPATEPVVEPVADPTIVAEPATEPAAEPATTDFTAKLQDMNTQFSTFAAKIADFEAKLAAKDEQISTLTASVSSYKAAETEALNEKKNTLICSYKSLLNEEEIGGIVAKAAEYSLEELESKLAVTYTRKQKVGSPSSGLQVNIDSVTPENSLPDFIRQAQEYDKNKELRLN